MSRAPEVADNLLLIFRAVAPNGVQVYDGPVATGDPSDAVFVGYDADPDTVGPALSSTQDWAGLGAKRRDETVTADCSLYLFNGAADIKSARTRAYEILGALEAGITATPNINMSPPTTAGVTSSQLRYIPSEDVGLEIWLTFTVAVQTRI